MADSVAPVTAPQAVNISAIESELESIWQSVGTKEHSVTRATAFNLVYVTRKSDPGDDPAVLLPELTLSHPARTVLVLLSERKASPTAYVTAYCHKPQPDAPQICSEFITIEADRRDPVVTGSTIRALLLGGLPSTVIWHPSLALTHPLLSVLADSVNRVLTRAVRLTDPASSLSILEEFWAKLPPGVHASDLIWSELSPWRNAVAALFDCREPTPADITRITINYQGSKLSAGAILLAAWMTRALEWTPGGITLRSKKSTVKFQHGATLEFSGTPDPGISESQRGKLTSVNLKFAGSDKASVRASDDKLTAQSPTGATFTFTCPETYLKILQRELTVLSHDPRRAAVYALAREWQKELLFS